MRRAGFNTLSKFVVQLNPVYGAGTNTYHQTADPNIGGGPDGIIYRTNSVQVVSARALPYGQTVLLQANGRAGFLDYRTPNGGAHFYRVGVQ